MGERPEVYGRGEEYRVRTEGGRVRRRDQDESALAADEGPAVHRVGDPLPWAVCDGKGRRAPHRLRRLDGQGSLPPGARWRRRAVLRVPGGGERPHLFHDARGRHRDSDQSWVEEARGRGQEPETGREGRGYTCERGRHAICTDG